MANKHSKKKFADFLINHTIFPGNSACYYKGYANELNITDKKIKEKIYDMINARCFNPKDVDILIKEFEMETGYTACLKSDCNYYNTKYYFVLYKLENDCPVSVDIKISKTDNFEKYDIVWLREIVELVQRFDRLCNDIIKASIQFATEYEIIEEEYTETKTRKVACKL